MSTLDTLDRRLLAELQAHGRASNVELSAAVHLSAPQCFRRVKSLEERGVIRGYAARVDREALGLGVMAFVSVDIAAEQFGHVLWTVTGIGHARKARTVAEALRRLAGVVEAEQDREARTKAHALDSPERTT